MAGKPTYEELEQKVRELEKEAEMRKRAEEEVLLHTEIVENMAEGVYLIRTGDGVIVYANKTFERMFGYDPGELVNKHVSIVNAPSEKSPEEIANDIIQSLKEKGTWSGEVRNIKKDGTPFWCQANVSTFDHHDFGEVWVSLHQDIGKRKRAEEKIRASLREKEVLLKEIHHRVKNNLQIISSLLDLSRRRTENQEAVYLLSDARAKVHTMALIHAQLYQSERFDQIDMGRHIQELFNFLAAIYETKSRFVTYLVKPSNVFLELTQALPCTLVLNELISNAFKHAFKEGEKGRIEASIQRTADDTIVIRVKDDGKGIPEEIDIDKTDTLGLKLARNLVQSQLGGRIRVEGNGGTEIVIEFNTSKEEGKYA